MSVARIGPVYVPQHAQPAEVIPALPAIPTLSALPPRPAFAGFGRRAVAYLIDNLFLSLLFGLVASFYPYTFLKTPDIATLSLTSPPQLTPFAIALWIGVSWFYFSVFEASAWQATPGKRFMRLYVADLNGKRVSVVRAAARNLARIISNLTFLVGYLIAGITERRQTLHDILASCLVLRRP